MIMSAAKQTHNLVSGIVIDVCSLLTLVVIFCVYIIIEIFESAIAHMPSRIHSFSQVEQHLFIHIIWGERLCCWGETGNTTMLMCSEVMLWRDGVVTNKVLL